MLPVLNSCEHGSGRGGRLNRTKQILAGLILLPVIAWGDSLRAQTGTDSEPAKKTAAKSDAVLGVPDVMWRSAVLPGWGQMRHGREVAGRRFMIGFISGAAVNVLLLRDYRLKKNEHNFASTRLIVESPFFSGEPSLPVFFRNLEDSARTRSNLETASRRVNFTFTLLLGLYGWNLFDAWWFHQRNAVSFEFQPGPDSVRFAMRVRF